MTLKDLKVGQSAVIKSVGGEGALRQHFLDMGVIPSAEVTLIKFAPMGDPMELKIHGYELTLRLDDAKKIEITPISKKSAQEEISAEEIKKLDLEYREKRNKAHPGLGEGGVFHCKEGEHPLPKGTKLTFALAGNQNCGKTTLFNQLTGSNQHVGNFPGVTVDRKSGMIKGDVNTLVTDLPGIYSLSPYTNEEIVSRKFIIEEKPTGIINITDATNLERNLYLTMQLMELDFPMVLALNMMDEVRGNGGTIFINTMEERLGIPVIPISAAKPVIDELIGNGYVTGRAYIGINGEDVGESNARYYDLPGGVYVRYIEKNSAAEACGIKIGDIIVAADGKDIRSMEELNRIKEGFGSGESITLTVFRDGENVEIKLMSGTHCSYVFEKENNTFARIAHEYKTKIERTYRV